MVRQMQNHLAPQIQGFTCEAANQQHWKDEHNGIQMDSATKKDIALDPKELGWVTQLLKLKTRNG